MKLCEIEAITGRRRHRLLKPNAFVLFIDDNRYWCHLEKIQRHYYVVTNYSGYRYKDNDKTEIIKCDYTPIIKLAHMSAIGLIKPGIRPDLRPDWRQQVINIYTDRKMRLIYVE